ncbi:unnamed protein product [Ilex paraguariensis]|uniref:Uncharacterized protein n=1 Tax=Ilex paraguariensis TaxID=185542 RepID=A0ABC8UGG3_9AQUA
MIDWMIEISTKLEKNKVAKAEAELQMNEAELKVSIAESKYASLSEKIGKFRSSLEEVSKWEETIQEMVAQYENEIFLIFRELKNKSFKEGCDVVHCATGVPSNSTLFQKHTVGPTPLVAKGSNTVQLLKKVLPMRNSQAKDLSVDIMDLLGEDPNKREENVHGGGGLA